MASSAPTINKAAVIAAALSLIQKYGGHRERIVEGEARAMREIAGQLNDDANEEVDLPEFKRRMTDRIIIVIAALVLLAYKANDIAQISQTVWQKLVGDTVRTQTAGYLDNFVRQIKLGVVSPVQIENRAALYAKAARVAYFGALKQSKAIDGDATLCRRIINSKEGCAQCAEYADMGWIPVDEMPDIGGLICGQFCACDIEYDV